MANRNPTRKRGISVGSSPSLTLRVTIAAARLIQENTGNLRLPKMFTAVALEGHRTRRIPTRLFRLLDFDPNRLVRLVRKIDRLNGSCAKGSSFPQPAAEGGRLGKRDSGSFMIEFLAIQSRSPSGRAQWH